VSSSVHGTKQLGLENVIPLLVFLRALIRLVVLPPHRLLALPAVDVADDVSARRHVSLDGFGLGDVDDGVEEVGFTVLASEVLWEETGGLVGVLTAVFR